MRDCRKFLWPRLVLELEGKDIHNGDLAREALFE